MVRLLVLAASLALAACDGTFGGLRGQDRARLADAAAREKGVVIWSSTDRPIVGELLADFQRLNPQVRLTYVEMPALVIHRLIEAHARSGKAMPDLVWTSAMDLQIKLVNDGYALRYASPEGAALPDWANWKNEAWGVTAEPVVMVYNRRLLPKGVSLTSHADMLRLLETRSPAVRGRVATYDIANSAVGYLYQSQDALASRLAWPIVRALGSNGVRLFPTSEEVIADVSAGRSVVGYNVLGSYAVAEMRRNPNVVVVLPTDYTLLASRIAVIPTKALHPNAARLFLDFLLSRRGQSHLVARAMPSARRDIAVPALLATPEHIQRAIRVGPALLVVQDRLTRRRVLTEWQRLVAKHDTALAAPLTAPSLTRPAWP